jgi:O-6-methylguanine DNA methyltransferase
MKQIFPLFKKEVYEITKKIPSGKVATYGQIARLAGRPKASRAVGAFMRQNTSPYLIPCHRVVGANGGLTGYAFGKGISTKSQMLLKEGVDFVGARVDLKKSQWKL